MKKNIILLGALMLSSIVYSQVGINNEAPKATLDVTAKTTDGTKPEGIIAPRLTGDQIKSADAQYDTPQKGAIVYATNAVTSVQTATDKTKFITAEGYYYFDGAFWQNLAGDWKIIGNDNIDDSIHFLGTINDKDLIFKRNDKQAGWLSPETGASVANQNTAFGVLALPRALALPGGSFNGAIGYLALGALTSGNRNQAMGNLALRNLTTGFRNVGIGNGAGRTIVSTGNNTAVGHFSLESVSPLDGNTAIGSSALRYSSGSNNVALGFNAAIASLGAPLSGSNNIAIGSNQNLADNTASNQLNIGGAIFGTGLSGSVSAPAGSIGIGTTAPSNTLHVKATADPLKLEGLTAGVATDDVLVATSAGVVKKVPVASLGSGSATEPWYVQGGTTQATSNTDHIYQTGRVAINKSTTTKQLDVAGDFRTEYGTGTRFNVIDNNPSAGNNGVTMFEGDTSSRPTATELNYVEVSQAAGSRIGSRNGTLASTNTASSLYTFATSGGSTIKLDSKGVVGYNHMELSSGSVAGANYINLVSQASQTAGNLQSGNVMVRHDKGVQFFYTDSSGSTRTGDYTFPTVNGLANQVLTTDGSAAAATLSWKNVAPAASNDLSGSGNAYACINPAGQIYRSATPCN